MKPTLKRFPIDWSAENPTITVEGIKHDLDSHDFEGMTHAEVYFKLRHPDLTACAWTVDMCIADLLEIENKLAARFPEVESPYTIRQHLVDLAKKGLLAEDELVRDWHQAYSSYKDFLEEEKDRFKIREIEYLAKVKSRAGWDLVWSYLKGSREGRLPSDVWERVVESGLMRRVLARIKVPITDYAEVDGNGEITRIK